MDFDTQLEEILVAAVAWAISTLPNEHVHVRPEAKQLSKADALAAIKQLIESKQPEKKKDLRDSLKGEYAHRTAYADGYNDALTAWREGMGLS